MRNSHSARNAIGNGYCSVCVKMYNGIELIKPFCIHQIIDLNLNEFIFDKQRQAMEEMCNCNDNRIWTLIASVHICMTAIACICYYKLINQISLSLCCHLQSNEHFSIRAIVCLEIIIFALGMILKLILCIFNIENGVGCHFRLETIFFEFSHCDIILVGIQKCIHSNDIFIRKLMTDSTTLSRIIAVPNHFEWIWPLIDVCLTLKPLYF